MALTSTNLKRTFGQCRSRFTPNVGHVGEREEKKTEEREKAIAFRFRQREAAALLFLSRALPISSILVMHPYLFLQ